MRVTMSRSCVSALARSRRLKVGDSGPIEPEKALTPTFFAPHEAQLAELRELLERAAPAGGPPERAIRGAGGAGEALEPRCRFVLSRPTVFYG